VVIRNSRCDLPGCNNGYVWLMVDRVAELSWKAPVDRLKAASPLFETLWNRHDVTSEPVGGKTFRRPEAGRLVEGVDPLRTAVVRSPRSAASCCP
jgi:MmyB-like transcription regulator ligand binding domain